MCELQKGRLSYTGYTLMTHRLSYDISCALRNRDTGVNRLVGWLVNSTGRNLEPRRRPVSGSHAEGDRVPRQKKINDQIWARVTHHHDGIMRHEHNNNHHSPYLWRVCRRDSQSDAITAMHTITTGSRREIERCLCVSPHVKVPFVLVVQLFFILFHSLFFIFFYCILLLV